MTARWRKPAIADPIKNGTIDRSHIVADLHEIASGKKAARTSADSDYIV